MDALGGCGVELGKTPVQPEGVPGGDGGRVLFFELPPEGFVRAAAFQQTRKEGTDIKPRSTGQKNSLRARVDSSRCATRIRTIPTGAVDLVWKHDVNQVVRDTRALFRAGQIGRA